MYDELTKLYYLNARYYNPYTGTFMSQDTVRGSVGDYGTWNLYGYCACNPVCYVDPSGHATMAVIAGAGLATVGGAATGAIIIVGGAYILVGGTYYVCNNINTYVDSKTTTYSRAASERIAQDKDKSKIAKKINGKNSKISKKIDMNKIFKHVFSPEHMKKGIMRLGKSKAQILNKFFEIALATSKQWVEGSNEIRTFIKGIKVTIRFYVSNGKIINLDGFVGYSSRVVGKLIKYTKK